jgi:hypothetical protein
VTLEGGAAVSEVEIQPIAPEVPEGAATVNVVTTAPGTLGPQGVAPVGTKATILLTAFSANWMKPASIGDANKIRAMQRAKDA